MKVIVAFSLLAAVGVAAAEPITSGPTGAAGSLFAPRAVLFNQTTTDGSNFVDQAFSDFPDFVTGIVDDFSTGGQEWNISHVTTYYTKGNPGSNWGPGITSGQLSFYSKSGASPGGADLLGNLGSVAVTLVDLGTVWAVVADVSGVGALQGINGDFWIGLTPNAGFATFGQEFRLLNAVANGDSAHRRNIGGGFGLGTDWSDNFAASGVGRDATFTLEGEIVPAPGAAVLLGVGGLLAARRRR